MPNPDAGKRQGWLGQRALPEPPWEFLTGEPPGSESSRFLVLRRRLGI